MVLKKGSRGTEVRIVQKVLLDWGFDLGNMAPTAFRQNHPEGRA